MILSLEKPETVKFVTVAAVTGYGMNWIFVICRELGSNDPHSPSISLVTQVESELSLLVYAPGPKKSGEENNHTRVPGKYYPSFLDWK